MKAAGKYWIAGTLLITGTFAVHGQSPMGAPATAVVNEPAAVTEPVGPPASETVRALLAFDAADVKFAVEDLMDTLRDRRHEGWVLAAYPDPKTKEPLIGAGFTLDLPARTHVQTDPLNSHPFVEPSSAELWQAAGLDARRLQEILAQYDRNLAAWKAKRFRKKIATLEPEISDEDAAQLLRISIVQAIYNAEGYFRNFDTYTASQQMALTQLVYQMGVNLQEFGEFLNLMNSDAGTVPGIEAASPDAEYWKAVQASLIHSQWARLYRARAVAVIAMLDPGYEDSSSVAERRVSATLRPARRASLRRAVLRRGRKRKARARKD